MSVLEGAPHVILRGVVFVGKRLFSTILDTQHNVTQCKEN